MKVIWKQDMHLVAKNNTNNEVAMDSSPDFGGTGSGARPMELVLFGLAGCMMIDLLIILKKARQTISALEVSIASTRSNTDPKIFSNIALAFDVQGQSVKQKTVLQSLKLSQDKYCSVYHMLIPKVSISILATVNGESAT